MKKGQTGTGPKQATLPHDSKANGQHFGRRAKQSASLHAQHELQCIHSPSFPIEPRTMNE